MADTPAHLADAPVLGTANEAAVVLRISRSQVYRLMDEGVIESVRVGSRRMVRWSSVVELLQPDGTAS